MSSLSTREILASHNQPITVLEARRNELVEDLMLRWWSGLPEDIRNSVPICYKKDDFDALLQVVRAVQDRRDASVNEFAPAPPPAPPAPVAPAVAAPELVPVEVGTGSNKKTILLVRRRINAAT
jgi:hypothetical protein